MSKRNNARSKVFAVQHENTLRRVIEVRIKNGNIYVNSYDRQGDALAHISQHASGQRHFKVRGKYVDWTGEQEPMIRKLTPPENVTGREEITARGWGVGSIARLPAVQLSDEIVVCELPSDAHTGMFILQTSIVGRDGGERAERFGFPVLWRYRFNQGVTVEVEAFSFRV